MLDPVIKCDENILRMESPLSLGMLWRYRIRLACPYRAKWSF